MQNLRRKVDQIDLRMLRLLQQRTRLSARIGAMKRRTGSVIYVPARERDLVARLTGRAGGLPAVTIAAVYREIMSGSRAAQGQRPIGLLRAKMAETLPAARAFFGAADRFAARRGWPELSRDLGNGTLSLALLTGSDLVEALSARRWRKSFGEGLTILGDFAPALDSKVPLERCIFIVGPHTADPPPPRAGHLLILIECKSTADAIKSLSRAMPKRAFHIEQYIRPTPSGASLVLARLTGTSGSAASRVSDKVMENFASAGSACSILGLYSGTEVYGG